MAETLPDSRLREPKGCVIADWPLGWSWRMIGGRLRYARKVIRLELEPIFCVNCGTPEGFVPRGIMSWVCFLCNSCAETHGQYAATLKCPDEDFWAKVASEMQAKYGRALTQA